MPTRPLARLAALALTSLLATACGTSGDTANLNLQKGVSALSASDYPAAVSNLEKAAEALAKTPADPRFRQAQVALAQARAHVDAKQAASGFNDFMNDHRDLVKSDDVVRVANALSDVKEGVFAAAELIKGYEQEFKTDAALFAPIQKKIQEKIDAGEVDEGTRKMLEGLGYLSK